jgi:hypothetical protein
MVVQIYILLTEMFIKQSHVLVSFQELLIIRICSLGKVSADLFMLKCEYSITLICISKINSFFSDRSTKLLHFHNCLTSSEPPVVEKSFQHISNSVFFAFYVNMCGMWRPIAGTTNICLDLERFDKNKYRICPIRKEIIHGGLNIYWFYHGLALYADILTLAIARGKIFGTKGQPVVSLVVNYLA